MHEFSLMQSVVDQLRESALDNQVRRVKTVRMTVGPLSSAFPPSLRFAFSMLTQEDPLLAGAELEIRTPPVTARCRTCGEEQEIQELCFVCGACGSTSLDVITGDELTLDEYEGEGGEFNG